MQCFNKFHIRRDRCSMSAFCWASDASDCNHEKNYTDVKAKNKKLDDNTLQSNTSLPSIADDNDLFFLKNENVSDKIAHSDAFTTLPQYDLIPNNNTSTMRPLGKTEHQKICNIVAYD